MKQTGSTAAGIVNSSLAIAALTVLVKALGYVEKRVQAHYFGTRDDIECYVVAVQLSLALFFVFRAILGPAVVPLLISARDSSPRGALKFGVSLSLPVLCLLGVCAAAGVVLSPRLVAVAASGFDEDKRAYCASLLRWLFPGVVIMTASQLLMLSLQVQKKFALSAASQCFQKAVFVAGIVALAAPFGFRWMLVAFWVSVLSWFGALALFHARHIPGLRRIDLDSGPLRDTALLAWPLLVGSCVSQLGRLAQNWFASTLSPGSIVSLSYAQAIVDLPLMLVPLSLSVVMFVYFSEFAGRKETHKSAAYLAGAVRYLLLVFLPLAVAAFVFRHPVTTLLFRGGQFKTESVLLTSRALAGLAPGLPFFALETVLMTFFFANRRIGLAIVCGIVATLCSTACLPILTDRFSLTGVGAYLTLSRVIKLCLLVRCLGFMGVSVPWDKAITFLAKTVAAIAVAGGGFALSLGALRIAGASSEWSLTVLQAVSLIAGTFCYVLALRFLGFAEWDRTIAYFAGFVERRRARAGG